MAEYVGLSGAVLARSWRRGRRDRKRWEGKDGVRAPDVLSASGGFGFDKQVSHPSALRPGEKTAVQ